MEVSLIPGNRVNGDLGVVNAARVSFSKEREQILLHGDPRLQAGESGDDRLIAFLARNGHWSPLAHPHFTISTRLSKDTLERFAVLQPGGVRLMKHLGSVDPERYLVTGSLFGLASAVKARVFTPTVADGIVRVLYKKAPLSTVALELHNSPEPGEGYRVDDVEVLGEATAANPLTFKALTRTFRIKAPIFVARQLVKHQRELVWNEVSRRYVTSSPSFMQPTDWRAAARNVKQGSAERGTVWTNREGNSSWWHAVNAASAAYQDMLAAGVCPEQARMVLPVCQDTEWWWTGSVDAFARVCRLRLDPHAQKETAEVARRIDHLLSDNLGEHWLTAKEWEAAREQH